MEKKQQGLTSISLPKNKKNMEPGQKVKVSGTKITGVVVSTGTDRNRVHKSNSAMKTVLIKHDHDGKEMEYIVNELRKI